MLLTNSILSTLQDGPQHFRSIQDEAKTIPVSEIVDDELARLTRAGVIQMGGDGKYWLTPRYRARLRIEEQRLTLEAVIDGEGEPTERG